MTYKLADVTPTLIKSIKVLYCASAEVDTLRSMKDTHKQLQHSVKLNNDKTSIS